ncbi:MAG: hypothetical protein IH851_02295 [Armatimonadetes bacterium]|nr:hypothetical protein [Armatimonadota bacterium]
MNKLISTVILLLSALLAGLSSPNTGVAIATVSLEEHITITTWNIENIGGDGRGFASGFGRGNKPLRTPAQLQAIADLIRDELGSTIIAIQEVSITHQVDGDSRCAPLDTIAAELGDDWEYFIQQVDDIPEGHDNLFCAYMWDGSAVNMLEVLPLNVPNLNLAGANLFDRSPLVGYFETIKDGHEGNDFVLVNVHMKSGQGNEENHLIAMTLIEHGLTRNLLQNEIKESDRIILGDFNDNPYALSQAGNQRYSDALYVHMAFKKYEDLVTEDFHSTRMDSNLTSIIDHILVNVSTRGHMSDVEAEIFLPNGGDSSTFAEWRQTFSDHFPISFQLRIENDDDVDF